MLEILALSWESAFEAILPALIGGVITGAATLITLKAQLRELKDRVLEVGKVAESALAEAQKCSTERAACELRSARFMAPMSTVVRITADQASNQRDVMNSVEHMEAAIRSQLQDVHSRVTALATQVAHLVGGMEASK